MTQDAIRNTQDEMGPVTGDFSSLKKAAEARIRAGDNVGINPHKVLRLCREFAELQKGNEELKRRVLKALGPLVADARHRFDDCRNNFEDGTEGLAEGGYGDELTEAIGLLGELEKGVRVHSEDTLQAVYKKGFADAKLQILQKIRNVETK